MPNSRHRAPSTRLRHRVLWAVAAFLVAVAFTFLAPLGDTPAHIAGRFLLLALCFAIGSLAHAVFLARPFRHGDHIVLPMVREPAAIEQAPRETRRPEPAPARSHEPRAGSDAPSFASSEEIGTSIAVTVLVTGSGESAAEASDMPDRGHLRVVESIPAQQTRADHDDAELETDGDDEETGPYPGAVPAKPDGRSPDSAYRVKGNTRSKRYHTMQSPYYERTKAGVWFRTAADAERAGFSPWNSRLNNAV